MSHPLFGPEVREMLAEHDTEGLRSLCDSLHPATVAEVLDDEFTPEQIWEVISPSDLRTQAAIFEYLPTSRQVEMVEGTGRPQVGKLVEKMSHDDRADLLRRLPARVREALLRLVDEADRRDIATLFTYEPGTVGSLMTTDYAWLPPSLTAAEAIDQLRQQAPDRETIYYVYVLGEHCRPPAGGGVATRRLLGIVSLRDLILAPRHAKIGDLMETEFVALKLDDDRKTAAETLARYDFIAMPVVDPDGGMLGIVTHDDVIDVLQQEATEDLQKQAGVGPIEGAYLEARFASVWWNRVKWLSAVFVAQMFTINAMAFFQVKIEAVTVLAIFVPLCLSVGGNTGSQAATLVIRAMALGEVRVADWVRVFRRELLMGTALALSLGALALIRTYFLTPEHLLHRADHLIQLTNTISFAVMGICLWGTILGSMLPIAIQKMGFDPALMSSPIIATLSDVSGIFIFFGVATLFFF